MPRTRTRGASPEDTLSQSSSSMSDAVSSGGRKRLGGKEKAAAKKGGASADALLVDSEEKWKKWNVRTRWTFAMIGGFLVLLYSGHLAVAGLVAFIQMAMFGEILALRYKKMNKHNIPSFRVLTWMFYLPVVLFVWGRALRDHFLHSELFMRYHTFVCFGLYVVAFLFFVGSLKKGLYRYQFAHFGWTHMALFLIVSESTVMIYMIFEGIIWFFLPASLVICNDIMAFVFGFFFGRTPLIKLSPKKTWEGFIGGSICTILCAIVFSAVLIDYEHMVCSKHDLTFAPVTCTPGPEFIPRERPVPELISSAVLAVTGIHWESVSLAPMQVDAMALAAFASSIAPFGGFFASGFKRAFRVKDFGDTIPGHGGLTDRMDCQILMSVFTYVYYVTFVRAPSPMAPSEIITAALQLPLADQMNLVEKLQAAIAS